LPVLYPKVFPNLEKLTAAREDLVAILLTGLPAGIIPGFQNASKKKVFADMLRLNVAVAPSKEPKLFGLLDGDLAGFPNGRRLTDDITSIELRAIAGVTFPLVEKDYKPDGAAGLLEQGITALPFRTQAAFPYVATPHDGFDAPSMVA
jgi:hypothetical protein